MTSKNNKEQKDLQKGIIIECDAGFGIKFKDPEGFYVKILIQEYNQHISTHLFTIDDVAKLLQQFRSRYNTEATLNNLIHQEVVLSEEKTNGISDAIAKNDPDKFLQFSWIKNTNWD